MTKKAKKPDLLAIQIANKAHLDATTAIDNWFLNETQPANI